MRGIQINNYFNNHITLNGKKINQEPQTIAQHPKTKQLNPHLQDPNSHPNDPRPPLRAHQHLPKKRTNTLVELKKHIPSKRSISTDRQRNAVSAKKKEEALSNESDKEEEPLTNMSQRKLKPSSSKGGLGKRSKSTIIKTAQFDIPKPTARKEPKKFSSNPTDESVKPKNKRKKSSKIIQHSKQMKPTRPLTARREFIPVASKQAPKKDKLALTIIKAESRQDKKASLVPKPKVAGIKKKQSKPVSARQKKSKKNRFIEELKEKYQNQTILQGDLSHRVKGSYEAEDNEFMVVMNNLQKVLSSVGSKDKLKHELKLISQKLKEFKLHSDSEQSNKQQGNQEYCEAGPSKQSKGLEEYDRSQEEFAIQVKRHFEEGDSDEEQPLTHKIEEPEQNVHQQQPEGDYHQNDGDYRQHPLLAKRNRGFFFEEDSASLDFKDDQKDRQQQIEALKRFKNESTKMMEKVGLNLNPEPCCSEPPKEQEATAKSEGIELAGQRTEERELISNDSNLSNGSGVHSMEDKYPVNILKSPKFDQLQLMGIISLKEQFLSDKHDKMSQLVKKMFEKQLVSPKSFESQLKSLNKRYEAENSVLQSIKKQAEQMNSWISEIKKDKEEILGIDELIRNQKWEEAKKLVTLSKSQPIEEIDQQAAQTTQQDLQQRDRGLDYWQREEGWERVEIKRAEVENNEFVDIGEITNRTRSKACGDLTPVDIDEECGGTEESIELEEECIYYNEDNDTQEKHEEGGIIKLVQIQQNNQSGEIEAPKAPEIGSGNYNVFHIDADDVREKELEASGSLADKNQSNASGVSSQSDRKGFTTNLYFIKQYCIALCEFVRDNEIFKSQFKANISKPLVFNLPDLLRSLREDDLTDYLYRKRGSKVAITELIWNQFNAQYQTLKFNSSQGKSSDRYKFQKEQEIIFIRMIYDVLNESLDSERPGSHFGKALPWLESAKHLKNLKQANQPDKDNVEAYDLMFGVAIARIIQWGSCLCGFLPDTVELENTEIDEPYVQHIRQTRMAFLLQKMMAAEESVMTNFQMQETEVEFKLAQLIIEELFEEATSDIDAALQCQ